jgi:hypothetical protein
MSTLCVRGGAWESLSDCLIDPKPLEPLASPSGELSTRQVLVGRGALTLSAAELLDLRKNRGFGRHLNRGWPCSKKSRTAFIGDVHTAVTLTQHIYFDPLVGRADRVRVQWCGGRLSARRSTVASMS